VSLNLGRIIGPVHAEGGLNLAINHGLSGNQCSSLALNPKTAISAPHVERASSSDALKEARKT